jgi:hypothetical protein
VAVKATVFDVGEMRLDETALWESAADGSLDELPQVVGA